MIQIMMLMVILRVERGRHREGEHMQIIKLRMMVKMRIRMVVIQIMTMMIKMVSLRSNRADASVA